jgi:hypothetical protein
MSRKSLLETIGRAGGEVTSVVTTGKTLARREKDAAIKLQAATRGMQGRKEAQEKKESEDDGYGWFHDAFNSFTCGCAMRKPNAKYIVTPTAFPGAAPPPVAPPKPPPPAAEDFTLVDMKTPVGVKPVCVYMAPDASYILQVELLRVYLRSARTRWAHARLGALSWCCDRSLAWTQDGSIEKKLEEGDDATAHTLPAHPLVCSCALSTRLHATLD